MKVILHGKLARLFGDSYEIQTATPAEAIEGLSRQLEGWPRDMLIDVVDFETDEKLRKQTSVSEIHLVPALAGGGGIGKVIIGAALIAVAIALPGLGTIAGMSINAMLFSVGASLVLAGVMQMFMKTPSISKSEDPPASKYIGVNQNTTAIGTYRALAYGRVRVHGHWLSLQVDSKSLVRGRFPETAPA